MDYSIYEPHIDFLYTTLLMIWGGSCIGIGMLALPYIFNYLNSPTEASYLTSGILKRQDILIRIIAICMLVLFYFKSKLLYSYQHIEWITYVIVLHCFIFGKVVSKKLWKLREEIDTFDNPMGKDPKRIQFKKWHIFGRILYVGQIFGVVALLYLHAFGL
jgi:hypothetical protein